MTELERKALLGDPEAQKQCTEQGIILPCPWCGCSERDMLGLSVYHDQYFYCCEACGCNGPIVFDSDECDYPEYDALNLWNTRHAPPIGKCEDCKNAGEFGEWSFAICKKKSEHHNFTIKRHDSCNHFEPKEPDHDTL